MHAADNNILEAPGGRAVETVRRLALDYALYALIILVFAIYAFLSPVFLSQSNITGMLVNSSPLLIVVTGMTLVLLVGEIDLSVGSIAGMVAMTWLISVTQLGLSALWATVLAVVLGCALGAVNGLLVVGLKINSFLVTLGMQILLRGVTYIICASRISITEDMRRFTNANMFWGLSPLVAISVAVVVLMALVYRYSSFGRCVQAIGCDRRAAAKVGVRVDWIVYAAFVICGVLAGLGGIVQVSNVGVANAADTGMGMEFLAITAAVLGGTSLLGGKGSFVPGAIVGVLFLTAIENGLGVLSVDPYLYPIVRGLVIYLAMLMDSLKHTFSARD